MALIAIVAVSKDLAIGKDGKLPWHYPADLKFFKETTTGNAIVMGANTFEAIGRALPDRLNVVLSSRRRINVKNILQLASVEEVVELSKYLDRDVYIIGGAKTYAAFSDTIDKWIVTEVPINVPDADVFMPENFLDDFEVESMRDLGDGLIVRTLCRRTD